MLVDARLMLAGGAAGGRSNRTNHPGKHRGRAVEPSFGGSGEIRTHGGREPSPVFKTGALNRSATLPAKPMIITHLWAI